MDSRTKDLQIDRVNTLVFEGCGSRFFTYMFALDALQNYIQLDKIQRVAASSSGAIVATLLSVGFTPQEMTQIFESMQFLEFLDPSKTSRYIPVFGPVASMISHRGTYLGEKCAEFFKKQLNKKGLESDITFEGHHEFKIQKKLPLADLYLTAANVTRQGQLQVFSHETTPHVPIVDALIAAIAYPGCIQPREILMKTKMEKFIDGGVRDNFPFNIFPIQEWPFILGLKVDTKGEIFGHAFAEPSLSEFLYELVHDGEYEFKKYHKKRTIQFYDCNLDVLQTTHSLLEKFALKISGEQAVKGFFEDKKGEEKSSTVPESDDREIQLRTSEMIKQLKNTPYAELSKKIEVWSDEKEGPYVYYHVILEMLRRRPSYLYQPEYNKLWELVKSRSIATSFYASSSADHIMDVVMTYLKARQGDVAFQYLKKLQISPHHFPKLLDIDHEAILEFLAKKQCCSQRFQNKDKFIELIEALKERKLQSHPGAYEAAFVMKIDAAIKREQFENVLILLLDTRNYLRQEEAQELFYIVQKELSLKKKYFCPALDEFLEKKCVQKIFSKNKTAFFQERDISNSETEQTWIPTKNAP